MLVKKWFNLLCVNFGFDSSTDFFNSLIHLNWLWLTIPITGIAAFVEQYLGLNLVTLFAFGSLIILELGTGLLAARIKGKRIESGKFGRFGLKLVVWFFLFFIINSMKNQYVDDSNLVFSFYSWIHTFILGYVNMEYIISVLENLGVISGKSNNTLIGAIRKKFSQLAGVDVTEDKDKEEKS